MSEGDRLPGILGEGHIDLFSFSPQAGGLLLCGWVSHAIADRARGGACLASFTGGQRQGPGLATFYTREGLGDRGTGIILFLACSQPPQGALQWLRLGDTASADIVTPTPQTANIGIAKAAEILLPILQRAQPALPEKIIRALQAPPPAPQPHTPPSLPPVLWHIDDVIACPPSGAVLIGWCLARPGALRAMHLRAGGASIPLDLACAVRVPRTGVLDSVGQAHGFDDPRCGFLLYLPAFPSAEEPPSLRVETSAGAEERPLPPPRLHGLAAIRHILDASDAQYQDLQAAFDHVLGPAVTCLGADHLANRGQAETLFFGAPHTCPTASLIIPLYKNLDFAEVQCALFSTDPALHASEIIYVLDDPPARRDAENLFASIHARFALPLILLVLPRNLGFAPACNAGLAAARGPKICFLNSDVFPTDPGWLNALCAHLDADPQPGPQPGPRLGIVGPRLLHEDGSLQHAGMVFRPQPQYAGWYFGHHPGLGLRPPEPAGLERHIAITGACMVMPADLARDLGGFDEAYIMGDFEDSDLCLRARARGFAAAVDPAITMVHPARRSQPTSQDRWRMNLTLHNAWVHQGRWRQLMEKGLIE